MSSRIRRYAGSLLLALMLGTTTHTAFASPGSVSQDVPPPTDAAPGEIVESWALAPAGSLDPSKAGNRSALSYDVDPGATLEDAVTLYNYGTVQLTFRIYATDAFNNADGQFDLIPGSEAPSDVGAWVTLPQENITVPPRQQVVVPFTLKVPSDATAGDHVGAILASNDLEGTGADGATVSVDRRTGTRMYVRVAGDLAPELAIENLSTTYKPTLNPLSGTATVTYRIQNRGNVRLGGSHAVSVSGPFGVAKRRLPKTALVELLPGEGVTITAEFEDVPAAVLEFTEVRLDPAESDAQAGPSVTKRKATTFAPPIAPLLLGLAFWLAWRARRAFRRHRAESGDETGKRRVLEPQQS